MGKSLIIAEKPSVAADIAKAIGGFTRQGEFFESDDYVRSATWSRSPRRNSSR